MAQFNPAPGSQQNSEKFKNSFFCNREIHMKIASLNNKQYVTEGVIWSPFLTLIGRFIIDRCLLLAAARALLTFLMSYSLKFC